MNLPSECHREHSISFTQAPVGRNGGPYSKWELCPKIARDKERCKQARWPEQHRDDCAWCALVAAERDLYSAALDSHFADNRPIRVKDTAKYPPRERP